MVNIPQQIRVSAQSFTCRSELQEVFQQIYLFTIFYVYTFFGIYSSHTSLGDNTQITEEVKTATVGRETKTKFVVLFKELLMAVNHHTIQLAAKLSAMGVKRHSSKRRLTMKS